MTGSTRLSHARGRFLVRAACIGLMALMMGAGCPLFPTGQPLQANAGPDRTVQVGQSVFLEGSASGGTLPRVFRWTQLSGPEQVLTDAALPIAAVSGLNVGTAVFRLTVTDADGETATDTVTVVVTARVD